jgi:orotate phosphoribosyltransferase
VGGLTLGADPVLAAALAIAGTRGRELRGFIVRKEAKAHGTGQRVEGPLRAGDRCCVVEDVTTTGGSAQEAIEQVRACGATVAVVVTVLDRGAGARELFESQGIPFRPLLTLADLDIPPR